MKKSTVISAGTAVAASALMALFGTGVAAADDYAGQTYADASSAASDAGLKVVVASRVGDKLSQFGLRRFLDRRQIDLIDEATVQSDLGIEDLTL